MTAVRQRNSSFWPTFALVHRLAFFLLWQAVIAGYFSFIGNPSPWDASVGWWSMTGVRTNVASILLLTVLIRKEGSGWRNLVNIRRPDHQVGRDLLTVLGILAIGAPVAYFPNIWLARLLYGDAEIPYHLFFRTVPAWVAVTGLILFPITIALSELPTYYGYVMPRLANAWSNGRRAFLVVVFWHALQHITLPFIPDWRFMVWRFGMFLPFALLLGATIRWRPRLLIYLMVAHGFLDLQIVWIVWRMSTGQ